MKARLTTLALALTLAATAVAAPPPTPPNPKSTGTPPVGSQPPTTSAGAGQSVGGTAAPLSADQLKVLDEALSKAGAIVADVESMAKGSLDGTGCPPSFSVHSYLQDLHGHRFAKEFGNDIPDADGLDGRHQDASASTKTDWQLYFLCGALASHTSVACSDAAALPFSSYDNGLPKDWTYADECAESYRAQLAETKYLAKAPDFLGACKEYLTHLKGKASPANGGSFDAICAAWRDSSGDARGLATVIQHNLNPSVPIKDAVYIAQEMLTSPNFCSSVQQSWPYQGRICQERQDYRKALAAKDKGLCHGALCRVMMGDGAVACEVYAKKFKTAACSRIYSAEYLTAAETNFKHYADQVDAALGGSEPAVGNPKLLKEFNSRLDKLYDLRDRFDKASQTISPKKASTAPAPKKKGA